MLIFINKKEKNLPDLYSEKGVKKRKEKKEKIEVLHSLFRGHPKHVYLTAM
jgi:hypothetical protein